MLGLIELLILLGITGAGMKYMTSNPRDDDHDYYRPSSYSYHGDREDDDIDELLERISNSYATTPSILAPEIAETNVPDYDVGSMTRRFNTYFPGAGAQSTNPVLTGRSPRLYSFSRRTGRLEVDD